MERITSGGFTSRDRQTLQLVDALKRHVFTPERYFVIDTGIEHRFGEAAEQVHSLLYNSMGTTTDLLRYFPDSLMLDRTTRLPAWEPRKVAPEKLPSAASHDTTGLFAFFTEYKYSSTERKAPVASVPGRFVGLLEREAWLTYRRLTSPNPELGFYLDAQRTRIALIYCAPYAEAKILANWEHTIHPISVRKEIARPGAKAVATAGSGTPWVNFDIRQLKALSTFLSEDLFWDPNEATRAYMGCLVELFPDYIPF